MLTHGRNSDSMTLNGPSVCSGREAAVSLRGDAAYSTLAKDSQNELPNRQPSILKLAAQFELVAASRTRAGGAQVLDGHAHRLEQK